MNACHSEADHAATDIKAAIKRTQTTNKRKRRDRLDPRAVRIGSKTFWQVDMGSEIREGAAAPVTQDVRFP
jgi:hypothetical protein